MLNASQPSWSWLDRSEDMAAAGFRGRFVEVTADGRCSLISIDDDGDGRVWSGVEIDWLDVVCKDVLGRRLHERVGADGEQDVFNRLPQVA